MEQTRAAPDGQAELRRQGDQSDSSPTSRGKVCRVHLVGVINGQYVHLGPYTLPAEGELVDLFEFATTMKRLITVSQGQDTWWRLEYNCYGNPVPILSDDALKEAFAYFRERHSTLSPEAAASACRLYLIPTASAPPWTLADYLSEAGVVPTLNLQGLQRSVAQASPNPEPLDLWTAAPVVSAAAAGAAAAAEAGQGGPPGDGASSSSSSHVAQHQHEAAGYAAAAAAGASLQPPELLAATDSASFSAHQQQQQPVWNRDASFTQQQGLQQQLPAVGAAAAPRAAKRHAPGPPEQHNMADQQQQQQQQSLTQQLFTQQEPAAPPADGQQQGLSLQRQVGAEGSGGSDSRGSKAPKRGSDSSPRSQWQQQQQQLAAGLEGFELPQQQQQQPTAPRLEGFEVLQQQQQQQQQQQLGSYASPFVSAAAGPHAAGAPLPELYAQPQQQQQQQFAGLAGIQAVAGGMTSQHPSGLEASYSHPQLGRDFELPPELQLGAAGHNEAAEACHIAPQVDQLQQLTLTSPNNNNNNGSSSSGGGGGGGLPGHLVAMPLQSAASGVAMQPQPQQVWMHAAQQQQQQQQQQHIQLVNSNQLAVQLGRPGSYSMPPQGSGDLAAAAAAAAAAVTHEGDNRSSGAAAAAAAAAGEGSLQGLQLSLATSRTKAETKTKFADGRFKDEARHQQRLADMKGRCDALFGGAIAQHFRIDHHKRVACLVCDGTVVPYEAYHIDAIRKHFVRHHEPWLTERGVDVELWRKSCAPITKGLAAGRGGGSGSKAAATGPAAAAAGGGGGEAAGEAEEGVGRKTSGTRHADGRYKDPQQHQQRLADMQSRCAALFNGSVTQHWSIVSHKSISCHLCSQNITPYAAYHPDCLRKHFVRRHEDVLVAAGVDVSAWSKGIPMGRRKLKAMLLQQQQQQLPQDVLLQVQPQQQEPHQAALLQMSDAALQQQQQQQLMLLPAGNHPGMWAWLPAQEQQMQMQQQQLQHEHVKRSSSSSSSGHAGQQQQQQQQLASMPQLMPPTEQGAAAAAATAAAAAAVPVSWPLQLSSDLSSLQLLPPPGPTHIHTSMQTLPQQQQQQQQLFNPQQQDCFTAAVPPANQDALQQQQQQQLSAPAASSGQAFSRPALPTPADTQELPRPAAAPAPAAAAPTAVAVVHFAQPLKLGTQSFCNSSGASNAGRDGFPAAPGAPMVFMQQPQQQEQQQQQQQAMDGFAAALVQPVPAGLSLHVHGQQHQQQQQQQNELPQAGSSSRRSALAPALAAAAAAQQQQQQQQQQKPEPTTADWARSVAEACGLSPMSLGATPGMGLGFGPMSLSPAIGLQDLGMGGVGSLTEADVAAMWADDEEQDAALVEALLRQGPWSFEQ